MGRLIVSPKGKGWQLARCKHQLWDQYAGRWLWWCAEGCKPPKDWKVKEWAACHKCGQTGQPYLFGTCISCKNDIAGLDSFSRYARVRWRDWSDTDITVRAEGESGGA